MVPDSIYTATIIMAFLLGLIIGILASAAVGKE